MFQNDYEKEFETMVNSEMDSKLEWWKLDIDQVFLKMKLGVDRAFLFF